jgi:hypothetical protein
MNNQYLEKIYKQHPLFKESFNISKIDKEKDELKKRAMIRCFGLYAYGMEFKKKKVLNDERYKKEKIIKETSTCTFRPQISSYAKSLKYSYNPYYETNRKRAKYQSNLTSTGQYRLTTSNTIENSAIKHNLKTNNSNEYKEERRNKFENLTFRPMISRRDFKKVFNKDKSLANEKANADYFLRIANGRKDYIFKKIKKLSYKDESYDSTLILYNNINEDKIKNQTNNSGEKKFSNKCPKINIYRNDCRSQISLKRTKNTNIDISVRLNLRNELLGLDLNDDE